MSGMAYRLSGASIGDLVQDASDILQPFTRIRSHLPDELIRALRPVAYMEYRCEDFQQATKNIHDREVMRRLAADAEVISQRSAAEALKAQQLRDQLSDHQDRLERIERKIADLEAQLEQEKKAASAELTAIKILTTDVEEQDRVAAEASEEKRKALEASSVELGPDDADQAIVIELDTRLARALAAIQAFLQVALT